MQERPVAEGQKLREVGLGPKGKGKKNGKKRARVFRELRKHLGRMEEENQELLVVIAEKMAGRRGPKADETGLRPGSRL